MALPSVPEEREQGAVQEQEQLAASAPPALEESPAQADETAMQDIKEAVADVVSGGGVVPPEQQAKAAQQPPQRETNMWLLPQRYDRVLGYERKPVIQRQEDVSQLWAALAADPRTHPVIRDIAAKLTGGGSYGPRS